MLSPEPDRRRRHRKVSFSLTRLTCVLFRYISGLHRLSRAMSILSLPRGKALPSQFTLFITFLMRVRMECVYWPFWAQLALYLASLSFDKKFTGIKTSSVVKLAGNAVKLPSCKRNYQPISMCLKGKNKSGRTGLASISACWSSVLTYEISISLLSTHFRKW